MLPLHTVVELLNDAADQADCEHLSLVMAKHQPPARFAMIGQLIRFADNLGMAMNDAIQLTLSPN